MSRSFIITVVIVLGFALAGCDRNDDNEGSGLHLLTPNGDETLTAGGVFVIRWNRPPCNPCVGISLATDGGRHFDYSISEVCQDTCYQWTVPDLPSERGRIMITSQCGFLGFPPSTVADLSDECFTIVQGTHGE